MFLFEGFVISEWRAETASGTFSSQPSRSFMPQNYGAINVDGGLSIAPQW